MPCTLEPWEIEVEERRMNEKQFGRDLTDSRLLEEVACGACRTLATLGKLHKAPKLVQAWAKRHRMKDAKAGRKWPKKGR